MKLNFLVLAFVACTLATWPETPFATSDQWIVDAAGNNVSYAGVNWPGAGETMLPEGLQYQNINDILSRLKSIGMNAIRLTYAIQMIDEIYDNGGEDILVKTALVQALGDENGTRVFEQMKTRNPTTINDDTKRLQVFDAVVDACARHQLYVHLDKHVSQAMWCCSDTDGNTWWGDRNFPVDNWTRGLSYMAAHGRQNWPNLVSMALRNEPREPTNNDEVAATYTWQNWYNFVQQGVAAVHAAHPDVLVFLSGLSYDTYLTPVVRGKALTPGSNVFRLDDFGEAASNRRLVLELHNYENKVTNCTHFQNSLESDGFETMQGQSSVTLPVVITEFGFLMDATTYHDVYATCLAEYLPKHSAGWMLWVLAGSYYIRSGEQDYDETWGLLTHDWGDWRNPQYVEEQLVPMIEATLKK